MRLFLEETLDSRWLWRMARLLLALMFTVSGLARVLDPQGGMDEMRAAGLEPAWLFNTAVATTLLLAAMLVLLDRLLWLGAAALSVFLVLTIVVVHQFWELSGDEARVALFFAFEHLTVIGGMIAAAIASHLRRVLDDISRWYPAPAG